MATRNELMLRVLTALILLSVFITSLVEGGMIFNFLVFFCAILMSLEFDKMRGDSLKTILIIAAPLFFAKTPEIAIVTMLIGATSLYAMKRVIDFAIHWAFIAIWAVFFPCMAAIWLREQGDAGMMVLFWLIAVVVATDVGAYFTGKKFGKNKLAEKISPNKTREGAIGGVAFAVIASLFFEQSILVVAVAVLISILAIAGDLVESAIKRHFGVKDSGNLLPGHGGILDRLDSFLLTLPATALLYNFGLITW